MVQGLILHEEQEQNVDMPATVVQNLCSPTGLGEAHQAAGANDASLVRPLVHLTTAVTAAPHQVRWEVHASPSGVPYYHNASTGVSRWTLPTGPLDLIVPPVGIGPAAVGVQSAGKDVAAAAVVTTNLECGACGSSSSGSSSSGRSPSPHSGTTDAARDSSNRADGKANALRNAHNRLTAFRELLSEIGAVGRFDRYETWLPRLLGDSRFAAIPAGDRHRLFQQEVKLLAQQKRRAAADAQQRACRTFAPLLAVACQRGLLHDAQTVEQAVAAIAHSDLGRDPRWHSTSQDERQRLVKQAFDKEMHRRSEVAAAASRAFRSMVQQVILAPAEVACQEPPPFGEARRMLRADPRWKAVSDADMRQQLYSAAAAEAALRLQQKRRRQADDEDELAACRQRSRRLQAEEEFRSILSERVKATLEVTWLEARFLLGDAGFGGALTDLDEVAREAIFNEVRRDESARCLAAFAEVLRAASSAALRMEHSFEEVCALLASKVPGGEARLRGVPQADLRDAWSVWRRARLASCG